MSSRSLSRLLLSGAVAAAALTACDGASRVLAVRLSEGVADTTFSLGVGQEATRGVMRIVFTGVDEDSRCPSDVMCVWAGNAAVGIGVSFGMGPTARYVLNTTVDPRSVDVGCYRLTLADLQPYPVSTSRIPPGSYVATLRFQRIVCAPD